MDIRRPSSGAMWVKKSKTNQQYFYVTIELSEGDVKQLSFTDGRAYMKFVAFQNNYKQEDRHPDFKMQLAKSMNIVAAPETKQQDQELEF